MFLTLRHEWRLKCTEKYALDRVSGVSWELSLFDSYSLLGNPITPPLVHVLEKKRRKLPSDLWADFPRVALPTRARCGLQKSRFFIGRYREFAVFSSRDTRPVFIGYRVNSQPTNVGSVINFARDVLLRSSGSGKPFDSGLAALLASS